MKYLFLLLAAACLVLLLVFYPGTGPDPAGMEPGKVARLQDARPPDPAEPVEELPPAKALLDISVHTTEEIAVLFDRAEKLAMAPRPHGDSATIVLVLHGPEVEFFSINNYDKYKEIVDRAARLDAFDIVDVKICQTMMKIRGIDRDDIPSFIEQVPLGSAEMERLLREGYVYF